MAKITIPDINADYAATSSINDAFDSIETAIENTLSRDGTTPNSMSAELDMSSNDINNINVLHAIAVQIGGVGVVPGDTLTIDTAATVPNVPAGNIAATDVQAAINELDISTSGIGVDVASATSLTLGTGKSFDITGTTTITSITSIGVGTYVTLQFDGILTLTHHATDLVLPGKANIITAAGDIAVFYEYAAGDWRCVNYTRAGGGAFVTNTNGNPNISDTTIDVSTEVTLNTWESVGPTGSGANNIWAAMDTIPAGVDWVEIKIFHSGLTSASGADGLDISYVAIRKGGGTQITSINNYVSMLGAYTSAAANAAAKAIPFVKVPVDSSLIFDINYSNTFELVNIELYIVGYGYNS